MGVTNKTMPLIRSLMSDGVPRSAPEIAALIGSQKKYVRSIFTDLVANGEAHIESYRGTYSTMYFLLSPGTNAVKPESRTPEHILARARTHNRRQRAEGSLHRLDYKALDELYRASAAWWPKGDPVVIGAVSAMVRCGRQSA